MHRGLAPLLIFTLFSIGCPRTLNRLSVAGRNIGALFTPMRRLPSRVTRPARDDARLAVLWVGHATVLVQMDDRFVLTDPVFTDTVGQVSPRLVEPGIDPAHLPPVDLALISHTHFDHLSLGSLELIEHRVTRLIVPAGALVYVPDMDFAASELGAWERLDDRGMRVTAVPVRHVGWRYGVDSAWMTTSFTGYVVEYRGLTVYFGGDSAYDRALFTETARRFPRIDLALLPIAPAEPRAHHGPNHMGPREALQCLDDLGARRMVPIHFDTFINSADRVGDAPALLRRVMRERGVGDDRVSVLAIGEQRVIVPRDSAGVAPSPSP